MTINQSSLLPNPPHLMAWHKLTHLPQANFHALALANLHAHLLAIHALALAIHALALANLHVLALANWPEA